MTLWKASASEQEAALDVVLRELRKLVPTYVPWFAQQQIMDKLNNPDPETRAQMLYILDEALDAAAAARPKPNA